MRASRSDRPFRSRIETRPVRAPVASAGGTGCHSPLEDCASSGSGLRSPTDGRPVHRPTGNTLAGMGLRARIWPGLSARSIGFEAVVAVLGTVAVDLSAGPPAGRLVSAPALVGLDIALAVLLLFFRRSVPL